VAVLVKVSGDHYKGLIENQATVACGERKIGDNKDGCIPPVAASNETPEIRKCELSISYFSCQLHNR